MANLQKRVLNFVRVFTQHPVCAANVILLAAVAGIEQTFEELVFKCPDMLPTNKWYALVSSLGPAGALWVVGILGNNLAWRLCQGLKYRKEKTHDCSCCWPCFRNLFSILVRTSVIPLAWLLIVLVDGDMYVCYFWKPNEDEWNKYNKVQSQLVGWIYFGVCLLFGLISVFCHRYHSTRTYFHHIYATEQKCAKELEIVRFLQEKTKQDAKKEVGEELMQCMTFSAVNWESLEKDTSAKNIGNLVKPGLGVNPQESNHAPPPVPE